jgi:hypothetical protein
MKSIPLGIPVNPMGMELYLRVNRAESERERCRSGGRSKLEHVSYRSTATVFACLHVS